ncbi:hypothetical protein ZHAS_00007450 [Anopheles sinensis]|uniref:ZP domain-containing protein n=1 Tax=Anopheles sinensis TaxID=74873 RepID=A0A084VP62_ANOSI|nr:hypothetical protein ZHAS_00007450 [Anopheles sinensis]
MFPYEIRSLSGEPDYKSINLTWEVESVPTADDRPSKGRAVHLGSERRARSFSVVYCELQNWGPHRCRSKIVTDESAISGKNKQYSLLVKNLRMATKYSFHVKPQTKRSDPGQRGSGRADGAGESEATNTEGNHGQTIIIPTKGFSAHATQCLPHASEIEVETGPYFGGRIAAENGNCGVQGDASSPQETYVMRIDHERCGSRVSTRDLTVETYITVQENQGILTHSTRRFVVVCTFQPDTLTVRARLALPGKGGAAPVPSEWWPANGRNARVRQFNMVGKSGLVLKGSREDEDNGEQLKGATEEEEEDTGVPAEVRELPAVQPVAEDVTAERDGKAARLLTEDMDDVQDENEAGHGLIDEVDEYEQDEKGLSETSSKTASSQRRSSGGATPGAATFDTSGLLISACLAVILVGALVYLLQREFKKQRMIHQHQQMERTASERRRGGGVAAPGGTM